ncbi:MAG: type IV secretion system DNA-binding domain-containing protein [Legionellales bacterium]|jgi:type IV conjugative transfer system coupling protein TraD
MRNFTRGGQIFINQVLMWLHVVFKLTLAFVLLSVILWIGIMLHKTSAFERSLAWQYWLAESFAPPHKTLVIKWADGNTHSVQADAFIQNTVIQGIILRLKHHSILTARQLALWMAVSYLICILLFCLRGFLQSKPKRLRGSRLVSAIYFALYLKFKGKASKLHLGGIPLVKDSESQHILMVGSSGSGKTQGILELLSCLRAQGYKVIVLDPECTAVQYFYRHALHPETQDYDIIVNPMDARARPLAFWEDARNESQLEYIAAALVPEPKSGADPFWYQAARLLFLETAKVVLKERQKHTGDKPMPGMKRLLSLLTTADLKKLEDVLKGTIAESMVSSDAEKLALSVKSTLSAYLRCLELIEDTDKGFSLRNWVHEETDAWLFITSRDDKHETFKPLLSVILDIVANELLTLDEDRHRKIALVIDEEASLNPSRSLQALRARGRKRGICIISAYQTLAQATALSNSAASQALSSMYGTRVYFACHDAESARQASRDLGQQELLVPNESVSMGANLIRDGVSITQQHRIVDLVMPEQVMQLKARQAYLRVPGDYPITKITVPIYRLEKHTAGFIERELTTQTIPESKIKTPVVLLPATHPATQNSQPQKNDEHKYEQF